MTFLNCLISASKKRSQNIFKTMQEKMFLNCKKYTHYATWWTQPRITTLNPIMLCRARRPESSQCEANWCWLPGADMLYRPFLEYTSL